MNFDVDKLAKAKGIKIYDTALPIDWCDDVYIRTGFWPAQYGFVWSYDAPSVWGAPAPLTEAAAILLRFYNKMCELGVGK